MCLVMKGDNQPEERQYTESEDLRTPDVNEVMKTLWAGEDTEDMDKVDAEEKDEDVEDDSAFDENDADDLRYFFATQREQVVPDDPEIIRLDSGNRDDDTISSQGSHLSRTGHQNDLLDVSSMMICNRARTSRKSFDLNERSHKQDEDGANGEAVSRDVSRNEAKCSFSSANDRARLKEGAAGLCGGDISTLSLESKRKNSEKNWTKESSATGNDIQRDLGDRKVVENDDPGLCGNRIHSLDSAEEISLKLSESSSDNIPTISADEYANIDIVDEESFRAICDWQQNDERAKKNSRKSEEIDIQPRSSSCIELSKGEHADNVLNVDSNEAEKKDGLLIATKGVENRSLNCSQDAIERSRNSVINLNDSPGAQSGSHLTGDEVTQNLNKQEFVDEDYFGSDVSQVLDKCMELCEGEQADNEVLNNQTEGRENEDFARMTEDIEVRGSSHSTYTSEEPIDRIILVPASPEKQLISNKEDDVMQNSFTQDSVEENYFDSDDSEGLDKAICQVDDDFEMTSDMNAKHKGRVDDCGNEKLVSSFSAMINFFGM